ncbi:MAG TPA: NAD(P)H-hydrate dehydratase [Candidatus Thermoplasmatota archaeon]|nr:NAD(P)H-hydrate dehydratase [Candidatus Thermoplasmatota archaeon]
MVLSARDVAVLDANAEALGVPVAALMENAGRAVADRVAERVAKGPLTVVAGPGNNGGDGLVAARLLAARGYRVRVVTPVANGAFRTPLARAAWDALPEAVERVVVADATGARAALAGAGVVVDALLGVGLEGALREPARSLVEAVNAAGARVFAVDVPSGLGTPLAVRADETITFHDVKEGLTSATAGRIVVADIGIPREAALYTGPGEAKLYPRPRADQHKGQGGIVLVLGGGPYTGAPAVAGLAALRAGADLAIILTPKRAWPIVAGYSPNLVVRPLNGDDLDFEDPANRVALNMWLKKASSLVVGPGLGLFSVAQRAVHHAMKRAQEESVRVVVDADAISALADRRDLLWPGALVTPHGREFRILTGEDAPADLDKRAERVRLAAADLNASLLLKAPVDVVSDGVRVKLNRTGHPAMSKGGTGDALAGIAGALLAKGLTPFDAGRLAAWISGKAGERAVAEKSYGVLATDVVEAIPGVLRDALGGAPVAR